MLFRILRSTLRARLVLSGILVPALCVLLSSCGPSGDSYLRNGMGSSLAPADIRQSTVRLDEYFSLLCSQAGLSSSPQVASGCRMPAVSQDAWTAVVLQGMNDIDRRCDAYLEWLDDKRRSRGPLLSQINNVSDATTAIIGFADPDATKAINIVGQAFGLLTRSVENYNSRLLLEIEASTVNSIVIQERFRFRRETRELVYSTRPAAEYALRSYTRICLPFAIETQINDLSTLGSKREVQTSETSIYQSPAVAPVLGAAGLSATSTVRTDPTGQRAAARPDWSAITSVRIDDATGKAIQRSLCLTGRDADGAYGAKTEAALKIFKSISSTGGFQDLEWRSRTIRLSAPEVSALKTDCNANARNYLESKLLAGRGESAAQLAQIIRTKAGVTDPDKSLPDLREQIRKIRNDMELDNGPDGMFSDQITPDLYQKLKTPQG